MSLSSRLHPRHHVVVLLLAVGEPSNVVAVSTQMAYVNHEGVPESEDIVDYFTAVTLFKRHHFCVGALDLGSVL